MSCKLPQIHHKLETINSELKYSGWNEVWKTKNKIHYDVESEEVSEEFEMDMIFKKYPDAVVIVAYALEPEPYVYLTSCYRPAKDCANYPAFPEEDGIGNTWELPAGGVDPAELEQSFKGYQLAAARELKEEAGLIVSPDELSFLGKRTFSGTGSERLFFLSVEIKQENKTPIIGDGHPTERHTQVFKISLKEALEHIDAGYLTDSKTEIGLNRLYKKLQRKIYA
jgi:ADP-ribose pyrophosphatase